LRRERVSAWKIDDSDRAVSDPRFAADGTRAILETLGSSHVEVIEEE
jgi:hypothetical protein